MAEDPSLALQEGWLVLDQRSDADEQDHDSMWLLPVGISVGGRNVEQMLDAEGRRCVLIPTTEPGPQDIASAGVKVVNRQIRKAGAPRHFVEIRCEVPRLADLFDDLSGEMILAAAEVPNDPARACIGVLERWRTLLRSIRGSKPSRSSVVGALGEMLVAEQIVKRDPRRRIDIWVGREGQRHDFRRKEIAIEVKTSSSAEGRNVTVHGVEQLSPPAGGQLFLAYLRIEHVPGGDLTVTSMISRLCALGVPAGLVHTGLDERGLPPGTWPDEEFELREMLVYPVSEGFPRIGADSFSGGSVPSGVSRINYQIDLDRSPGCLSQDSTDQLFENLAAA
jgi:hypothetical protein